jgi:hypothetical protein
VIDCKIVGNGFKLIGKLQSIIDFDVVVVTNKENQNEFAKNTPPNI